MKLSPRGERSVGDFMSFFTALSLAFQPLRRLGGLAQFKGIGRDVQAVSDDQGRGTRGHEVFDLSPPALGTGTFGPHDFGLTDDLDAMAVDQIEVADDVRAIHLLVAEFN